MHKNVILVAETGSDITYKMAEELGIYLVPMHVTMGGAILDDGTFPPEDVCKYYDETGKCPTTAGSTPFDFEKVLDEIHAAHPDKKILHLAYSAVTTCSYQSCIVA
ncbi:MAG: DegV family protein, partial [Clostridia bacterium]|nr:DegV family protein [Clostridia bacterium]